MKIKPTYKRIIAKETLILFGIIAVGLLITLGLYSFNGIQYLRKTIAWNQVEKIDEEIDLLTEKRKNNTTDNLFMNVNQEQYLNEERWALVSKIGSKSYDTVDFESGRNIVIYSMLTYAILIYPVRLSFSAIKWSIKILKGNNVANKK